MSRSTNTRRLVGLGKRRSPRPELFDKLAGRIRPETGHGEHYDSARDTMMTFQSAVRRRACTTSCVLPQSERHSRTPGGDLGPVLAFKLQYVLERMVVSTSRKLPIMPRDGICRLSRRRGASFWTARRRIRTRANGCSRGNGETSSPCSRRPGIGQRVTAPRNASKVWRCRTSGRRHGSVVPRLPAWAQLSLGLLELYQWLGLVAAVAASWLAAR